MFKPDSTFKRLAKHYNNCAYVYRDGIMVWEKRTVKSGNYTTEISINHFWPCEIVLRSQDYNAKFSSDGMKCRRVIVSNPAELLSGLERIEVHYHNGSDHSREVNLQVTTVVLYAPNGMEWTHNVTNVLSDNITPQPNTFSDYCSTGPRIPSRKLSNNAGRIMRT